MRKFAFLLTIAGLIAGMSSVAYRHAQAGDERLALKGYDTVAYFTEGRPMVGDPKHEHEFDGAIYRFASSKHLGMFKADPDRYLPQYNNWCTASVGKGLKVHGNPEWWIVVDGKLYLFGKPIGPGLMRADPAGMTARADEKWPMVQRLPNPDLPDYMKVGSKAN